MKKILPLALFALVLTGCAAPGYGPYDGYERRHGDYQTQRQDPCVNYTGAAIGGVAGALLGNTVGRGSGRAAATAVGAGVGAVAGSQAGCRY